ncbi:TPA: hypothetical protein PXM37_004263 [Yersinia enterocolitica]|nr:hypothetical protein [Yersinia enterocolitica]HDL6985309.1 hypothetical protein [Yersinia enterocolitica]HDL7067851.1 hypothetical protein [Yersinia enterocolitica]HDL7072241.1 hypothetical protein [Yersinia enterocolitica]
MLKKVNLHYPVKFVEGVLVKQKEVDLNKEIATLKKQTVQKANNIIQCAIQDAEVLAQQGYMDGYQNGMLTAIAQTALYFGSCNEFFIGKRNELIEDVRSILSTAVTRPEIFFSIIDEWVKSLPLSDNMIYIYAPDITRGIEPRLKEVLASLWSGQVNVTYHSDNKYVMSCGQQVAEFSPNIFVEQAAGSLMDKFNLIPSEFQKISEDALESLIGYCGEVRAGLALK